MKRNASLSMLWRAIGVTAAVMIPCVAASCGEDETPLPPAGCPSGLTDCEGQCVSLETDNSHCGERGVACETGQICDGSGSCALSCQLGLVDCAGKCIDPLTDEAFCGAGEDCAADPGAACEAGQLCDGTGSCALSCQQGLVE